MAFSAFRLYRACFSRRMVQGYVIGACFVLLVQFRPWQDHTTTVNRPRQDRTTTERNQKSLTNHNPRGHEHLTCHVPRLSLATDTNQRFYHPLGVLTCPGLKLFYLKDSILRINKTVLGHARLTHCQYRSIARVNDYHYIYSNTITRRDNFEVKIIDDFLRVKCYTVAGNDTPQVVETHVISDLTKVDELHFNFDVKNTSDIFADDPALTPTFHQFFAQTYVNVSVVERARHTKPFPNSTQLNVLAFSLDSMSHLAYQRLLPKTYKHLQDSMNAIIMNGYNTVGPGTINAFTAFLTGQSRKEGESRFQKKDAGKNFVDGYPFIWNTFEQSGYVTMYYEDGATFTLDNIDGFKNTPTDHFALHYFDAHGCWQRKFNQKLFCLTGRTAHDMYLEAIADFLGRYEVPKFVFANYGDLSHNDNNPVQYLDDDLVAWLKRIERAGHLDNTVLIMMSDHGIKQVSAILQTAQGQLEGRLPFLAFVFPKKFQNAYPNLMDNLRTNADRVTTVYDLHETLHTILDIGRALGPMDYSRRGISHLKEIPANRTCASAGIPPDQCTCMVHRELGVGDKRVQKVAQFMVSYINDKLKVAGPLCAKLTLSKVVRARLPALDSSELQKLDKVWSKIRDNVVDHVGIARLNYQITLVTSPNDGLFQGSAVEASDGSLSVTSRVIRNSKYGDQSKCIMDKNKELKEFCYCV